MENILQRLTDLEETVKRLEREQERLEQEQRDKTILVEILKQVFRSLAEDDQDEAIQLMSGCIERYLTSELDKHFEKKEEELEGGIEDKLSKVRDSNKELVGVFEEICTVLEEQVGVNAAFIRSELKKVLGR